MRVMLLVTGLVPRPTAESPNAVLRPPFWPRTREEFYQRREAALEREGSGALLNTAAPTLGAYRLRVLFPSDLLPPIRSPGQRPVEARWQESRSEEETSTLTAT